MGKLINHGAITDSRDPHVWAMPQSGWKECAKCQRSTLEVLCWKCRDKEGK